ncbi:MAG: hypothetical protein WBD40_05315 [Tepidisphaeraceae bacterium]
MSTTDIENPAVGQQDIVARAGRYYRNTRYIMAVLLVGMAGWFAYDGWVKWPEGNRKIVELQSQLTVAQEAKDDEKAGALSAELKNYTHHNAMGILFQKVLALTLPPVGIGLLVWALYNSRGEYRLSGNTLSAPGHPTIALDQVRQIDKRLWDRKGIAFLDYEVEGSPGGRIKLDDFVYERKPTDQIFERVEAYVAPASEQEREV